MNSYETYNLNEWNQKIKKQFKFANDYIEENPSYESIMKKLKPNQIEEISGWVMRQYFDKTKNKFDFWYTESVDKDNVFKYISNKKNGFPHTLHAVVYQHKLNQVLKKTFASLPSDDEFQETAPKNLKSEEKLNNITDSVGGLSPTMINKITESALQKFKRIYEIMQSDDEMKFSKFYENLVDDIAESFTNSFYEEESLDEALAALLSDEMFQLKDLERLIPLDLKMLDDLYLKSKDLTFKEIKAEFVNDFWSEQRKNNLFQSSVSKFMNPEKQKGRKRLDEKN